MRAASSIPAACSFWWRASRATCGWRRCPRAPRRAADAAAVDAFYEAALAAGGTDNGAPGPRDYHPGYYAAFVHDPEGNNIEAVIHDWAE